MPATRNAAVGSIATLVPSPIGDILLTSDGDALTGLYMSPHSGLPEIDVEPGNGDAFFDDVTAQLSAYFTGDLRSFDVAVRPTGTAFQLRVWSELTKIPYGETISYADLAHRVGSPKGFRAVGQANGRNPVSVIVPCHRVIGADGSLTGFGGGSERKRFLLDLESPARQLI